MHFKINWELMEEIAKFGRSLSLFLRISSSRPFWSHNWPFVGIIIFGKNLIHILKLNNLSFSSHWIFLDTFEGSHPRDLTWGSQSYQCKGLDEFLVFTILGLERQNSNFIDEKSGAKFYFFLLGDAKFSFGFHDYC